MKKLTITIKKTKDGFLSECPEVNEWCDLGITWQENVEHLVSDLLESQNQLMQMPDDKLGSEMLKIKSKFRSMV